MSYSTSLSFPTPTGVDVWLCDRRDPGDDASDNHVGSQNEHEDGRVSPQWDTALAAT